MKLKNKFGEIVNQDEDQQINLTANQTLADMKAIVDAYKKIKKYHTQMKKWKKALNCGTKTQAEFDAVLIKAKELISDELTYASGYGLALGQGDDDAYRSRGDAFAANIVDDATN